MPPSSSFHIITISYSIFFVNTPFVPTISTLLFIYQEGRGHLRLEASNLSLVNPFLVHWLKNNLGYNFILIRLVQTRSVHCPNFALSVLIISKDSYFNYKKIVSMFIQIKHTPTRKVVPLIDLLHILSVVERKYLFVIVIAAL